MKTLIIIPARIASSRLPRKALADIGGEPLIVRTYKCSVASGVGDVIVACDCEEIADPVRKAGGIAILTDPALPSGTDRGFAALSMYDKSGKYGFIINVQGDLPFIGAEFIREADRVVRESSYDVSTLATPIRDDSYQLASVVKPVISFTSSNSGKALYFSRSPTPYGGPYYHHLGIYCFRRESLERFVSLPPSALEKTESLEQLRILENDMTIGITVVDAPAPISVDTPEDLERARKFCAEQHKN
jgi:3-deoxy-manno-octulosonate cytidylyltransferase (CMP-KDO synthetase)